MFVLAGIYAIVDPAAHRDPDAYLTSLLRAGIRLVQLRDKRGVRRDDVVRLRAICQAYDARLIVNDDVHAAILADGVHVGQEDLRLRSIAKIRALLGGKVIGVSTGAPAEARAAFEAGADYLGAGPYHATASKDDAGAPFGPDGLPAIVAATPLPVAAIGGITIDDLPAIVQSGARMAAVISALARASDPEAAARALVGRWSALTA